jgi:hypothetical protein
MFYCNGYKNVMTKIIIIENEKTHKIESRGMRVECKVLYEMLYNKSNLIPSDMLPRNFIDSEITSKFEMYMALIGCQHKIAE